MLLPLRDLLVAAFNETCAITSRKSELAQDMSISKSSKKNYISSVALLRLCFRIIASKIVNFLSLFDSKKTAANYFD